MALKCNAAGFWTNAEGIERNCSSNANQGTFEIGIEMDADGRLLLNQLLKLISYAICISYAFEEKSLEAVIKYYIFIYN